MPLKDQFWGDRYGQVKDPYGHQWSIGAHMEDVSPAEMKKRAAAAMAEHCAK
jgi:PhnB protein